MLAAILHALAPGPLRLSGGEARWHASDGAWAYIDLEMVEHEINGSSLRR